MRQLRYFPPRLLLTAVGQQLFNPLVVFRKGQIHPIRQRHFKRFGQKLRRLHAFDSGVQCLRHVDFHIHLRQEIGEDGGNPHHIAAHAKQLFVFLLFQQHPPIDDVRERLGHDDQPPVVYFPLRKPRSYFLRLSQQQGEITLCQIIGIPAQVLRVAVGTVAQGGKAVLQKLPVPIQQSEPCQREHATLGYAVLALAVGCEDGAVAEDFGIVRLTPVQMGLGPHNQLRPGAVAS